MTEEQEALLALSLVEGLGPVRIQTLVDHFGSALASLKASSAEWARLQGFGSKTSALKDAVDLEAARREGDEAEREGIALVTWDEEAYPALLREISAPPPVLYVRGCLDPEADSRSVAVVGSRRASEYGLTVARTLGRKLAEAGAAVVSGLAMGIDCSAHEGVLEVNGRTVAVLGSGILTPGYDMMRRKMRETIIAKGGAVVSEFPLRFPANEGTYPRRNRIISGWSLGTVVVEAAAKSGALSTATHAMEQGREVFAVPHRITSAGGLGANRLIRDGARIVLSAEDVLEELAPSAQGFVPRRSYAESAEALSGDARAVYEALTPEPVHRDVLARRVDLPAPRVASVLLELELKGLVRQEGAKASKTM